MTEKQKAMRDVQEHGFAAVDASLYLDSHPDDESAVQYFRNVCKKQQQAQEVYQNASDRSNTKMQAAPADGIGRMIHGLWEEV